MLFPILSECDSKKKSGLIGFISFLLHFIGTCFIGMVSFVFKRFYGQKFSFHYVFVLLISFLGEAQFKDLFISFIDSLK